MKYYEDPLLQFQPCVDKIFHNYFNIILVCTRKQNNRALDIDIARSFPLNSLVRFKAMIIEA